MRTYENLPQKYLDMMKPIGKSEWATWNGPIFGAKYVYYAYCTCVQGDRDRIFRFTKIEHKDLLDKLGRRRLEKGYVFDNFEPFVESTKIF